MAGQAGLEPAHRNPSVNGLAIRRSTCYAYCPVCTARRLHGEIAGHVFFPPGCVLFVIPHRYAPIYSKPEVNHRILRLCVILRHTRMGVNPAYPQGMTEPHMRMPAARQKIIKISVTPFRLIGERRNRTGSFSSALHKARGRLERPSVRRKVRGEKPANPTRYLPRHEKEARDCSQASCCNFVFTSIAHSKRKIFRFFSGFQISEHPYKAIVKW